jgi:hypothetical protein
MKITVKHHTGYEFGDTHPVYETIRFENTVDFERFLKLKREFEAEDEIVSISYDCR